MQLFKLLITMIAACGIAIAAPVDVSDEESRQPVASSMIEAQTDVAPRCGYVRLHEGDWPIIGIYSRAICEPIWKEEEATLFRIDKAGCSCKFFTSKEPCEKGDIVPAFTGPKFNESKFEGTKPTYVFCQMT